jgi:hypothetical protein
MRSDPVARHREEDKRRAYERIAGSGREPVAPRVPGATTRNITGRCPEPSAVGVAYRSQDG